MKRIAIMFVLVAAATGCSKKDKDKPAGGSAAPAGSAAPGSASDPGPAAATPPADNKGIDVCAWVPKEKIEAVLGGKLSKTETLKKMGSQLGGCSWETEDYKVATVTPRPAGEFDGTVKASGTPTDVPGVGEKAVNTSKGGLLVKVSGKPYFLHVFVIDGAKGMNAEKSIEIAKVVVPAAQ